MSTTNFSENERLSALQNIRILDTQPEERFDRITSFVAQIFHVPVCGIAFIANERVWYKSKFGFSQPEVPMHDSTFEQMILSSSAPFIVLNAKTHPTYSQNILVKDHPHITTYAGVPIYLDGRFLVGTLFIADSIPHQFSSQTTNALYTLASWVESELANTESKQEEDFEKAREELSAKNHALEIAIAENDTILGSIGDGVVVINDRGSITFANKQAEMLLACKKDQLIGKLIFNALKLTKDNGDEVTIAEYPIRNAIYRREKMTNNNFWYQRYDGSKFAAATTATPIMIGEFVRGGVIVFRDISKERDIDRMKTEFISLASHQLRTPLSAIKWFTEMILDGDVGQITDEQKDILNNVYQSNERMIELVNTLLNISRIESGRIIIDPKPTDLKKLVDEVVVELQPKLLAKKHTLAVSVHESLPEIMVDPKLVRHVYMNLLTNAIKYTPENGQIVVMISKSGNELISQVSDNGYGIPKEQMEKVFTKFFRAKNIVGIETDGTGLGLYLTKSIVESSGGRIWFESTVSDSQNTNHGTSFWVTLPITGTPAKKGEVTIDG